LRWLGRALLLSSARVLLDLLVLSIALWLGFLLRFDGDISFQWFKRAIFCWPWAIGIQYFFLFVLDVPRCSWRHVGLREAKRILAAMALAMLVLAAARLVAGQTLTFFQHTRYAALPFGVIAIDFLLASSGLIGIRVLRRISEESSDVRSRGGERKHPVRTLLLGAGQVGLYVAKEIQMRPDSGLQVLGFLDDDSSKRETLIHGVRVLGPTDQVGRFRDEYDIDQVIITIGGASGGVIRKIARHCEAAGIRPKIIPGIFQLVEGHLSLSRIREVEIEDILGREPVALEIDRISSTLTDEVILVTGAGGSIGSELCRQLCQFTPAKLLLFEQAENALYEIQRSLTASFPAQVLVPCLGDILDRDLLEAVFSCHEPRIVFHAAAHKHVPLLEANPREAVKNNIFGTKALADAAETHGVQTFVGISTDKAVNPSSVMGATKRVAEMYLQSLSQLSRTQFVAVRFGNVLGSTGSVIPLFKEQIAQGGPVTVTHPEMCRYFMTIPEAAGLVLQAASMGKGGEIFVLDMGTPVRIVDLAKDLIRLSGLRLEDIEIQYNGIRPGEKLFEELLLSTEDADTTRHPKIFIGKIAAPQPREELRASLAEFERELPDLAPAEVVNRLRALVPEYSQPNGVSGLNTLGERQVGERTGSS
jgi:FlaA1/EpsC-like NDP-sugar epimerase